MASVVCVGVVMRAAFRGWVASALALLVLAGSAPALARNRAPATGLKTVAYAKAPPDFAFDVGSGPQRLSAFRGKPTVINFWATWCAPCRAELGAFEKLAETFGDRVALLTVSPETPGLARTYLASHDLGKIPVIEDPLRKIHAAYSVEPIPVTLILDKNGAVGVVIIGEITWEELSAAVGAALAAP
ncbi:MAG: TlpA family protein disulfide reductase [Candidatus Eremiobacteraeota bacterium]|nr:TlpA family protein disulfide reductase [Candidatus Eremiobacteraeota bacterium]